jgi:hypothetical protein
MFRIARPAAGARPVLNMANNPVQNAPGKVRHQQPWPLAGGIFGIQHPRPPPLMPFNGKPKHMSLYLIYIRSILASATVCLQELVPSRY